MSRIAWSKLRGKRLDFSMFRSGNRMEYVLAGVLGIVIIGAIVFTVKTYFLGGSDKFKGPSVLHYQCEKCKHEFEKKPGDLPVARHPGEEIDNMKLDCPSCGAKKSCWREIQCPKCQRWYVSQNERNTYELGRRGRGSPDPVPDICPYPDCKTNYQEWYRTHQQNQ